jgi:uncharacterized repeat protein (TIGR03803 family)
MPVGGILYGTSLGGGAYPSGGTVFKMTLTGAETVLYSFGKVRQQPPSMKA